MKGELGSEVGHEPGRVLTTSNDVVVGMGLLSFVRGNQASEAEKKAIERKCSAQRTALHTCREAYSDGDAKSACGGLELQMMHCACTVVCKDVAHEYEKCTQESTSHHRYQHATECQDIVTKMRKCLEKKGIVI